MREIKVFIRESHRKRGPKQIEQIKKQNKKEKIKYVQAYTHTHTCINAYLMFYVLFVGNVKRASF